MEGDGDGVGMLVGVGVDDGLCEGVGVGDGDTERDEEADAESDALGLGDFVGAVAVAIGVKAGWLLVGRGCGPLGVGAPAGRRRAAPDPRMTMLKISAPNLPEPAGGSLANQIST